MRPGRRTLPQLATSAAQHRSSKARPTSSALPAMTATKSERSVLAPRKNENDLGLIGVDQLRRFSKPPPNRILLTDAKTLEFSANICLTCRRSLTNRLVVRLLEASVLV